MLRISRDDLQPVLAVHRGTEALQEAVEGADTPPHFLSVFARYIQFNSAFGPGLANLAGEIAARQGLFRDREEVVTILADRAAEVAPTSSTPRWTSSTIGRRPGATPIARSPRPR